MSKLLTGFGERLRAMRKQKGMSQDTLSRISDIDRSYVGRMDRGEVNITIDKLYAIARALECQPSDLLPQISYTENTNK